LAEGDLDLDDPHYADLDREALLRRVIEAERIALASDPRVTNAHRSSVHAGRAESWYASTDSVFVRRAGTSAGYSVVVVAQDASGERQTGGYGTRSRHLADLKSPDTVGREAGNRAVRHFGWKPAPTGRFPVLYDREVASEFLGVLASATAGGSIYRGSSFMAGKLGETVASTAVTVIDDPLIPRGLGSRNCDSEGVRARRLTLVDAGRLSSYLVSSYAARRLGHAYTGHDSGCSNLRLVPGTASQADLLRELGTGLLVQDLHGFGIDLASGTYSKGVSGFWVENGIVTHPVQEATIAGNLKELWPGIRRVGNDPLDEHAISSPSLLIDGFTIAGTR
jgi:PmbA protein